MKEDLDVELRRDETTEAGRMRVRENQIARVVQNIDPRVKKHTELYNRVVLQLQELKRGRCRTWGETSLSKEFHSWARIAHADDKPNLDAMIALFAAHGTLSTTSSDKFSTIVEKRHLRQWVEEELRLLDQQAGTEEASAKKGTKAVKAEAKVDDILMALGVNQSGNQEVILPSIEQDPPAMQHAHSKIKAKRQRVISPESDSGSDSSHEDSPEELMAVVPTKRHKTNHENVQPARDANMQTDNNLLPNTVSEAISDMAQTIISSNSKVAESIATAIKDGVSTAIKDGMAQQTESLKSIFQETMQMMFRHGGTAGDHNRDHDAHQAHPMPATQTLRPALVLFDQQAIPTAATTYRNSYDRQRHAPPRFLEKKAQLLVPKMVQV